MLIGNSDHFFCIKFLLDVRVMPKGFMTLTDQSLEENQTSPTHKEGSKPSFEIMHKLCFVNTSVSPLPLSESPLCKLHAMLFTHKANTL